MTKPRGQQKSRQKDLSIAIQYLHARQWVEAEATLQCLLQLQHDNADAIHLLGVLAAERGQYEVAIERIQRAIEINSNQAVFHSNLGNALF